jgi:hypothetical protein
MKYHAKLGFPKSIKLPQGRRKVIFTYHALDQAKKDKYGDFSQQLSLHNTFDPRNASVVEIETDDKINPTKVVYRLPLSPTQPEKELVMALVPYPGKWVAKTVWINEKADFHRSLNVRKYDRP